MTFKTKMDGFLEVSFRIFLLTSTFVSIDMLYHYLYEKNFNLYAVPLSYYLNKLQYGMVIGILAFYLINNSLKWTKYNYKKVSLFSLIIVIPLQIRYFITGHFTMFQNIVIATAHYFMIVALITIYYKIYHMDYIG